MTLTTFIALSEILSDGFLHGDDPEGFGAALLAMGRFIAERLTVWHPDLGREGAVCPYIARAIARCAIQLRCSAATEQMGGTIMAEMHAARSVITDLLAATPAARDRMLVSLVVLFPGIRAEAGYRKLAEAQRELKTSFVEQGLMIGEFFPGCPSPGLHNPDFRPFDAPVASLAVRQMTVFDAPFMTGDRRHVAAYLRHFGPAGEGRLAGAPA
ncbi:MAG: DUF6875 domain-containing protein [Sphingomonas sp.]